MVLDAPVVTDERHPRGLRGRGVRAGLLLGRRGDLLADAGRLVDVRRVRRRQSTPHPSYEEVCSGQTGHTEAVRVVFDPSKVAYADLVKAFFEIHDPTQGMRQGNDVGTQYRSAIYTLSRRAGRRPPRSCARPTSRRSCSAATAPITTEIKPAPTYYYAEDVHQQYLAKNPHGYRCHSATGVPFPAGV